MNATAEVVIIGTGIIGASCALACVDAGLDVVCVDQGALAGGTTGAGEGNILVSDKEPGPELELAMASRDLWVELGRRFGETAFELEAKGGLVLARSVGDLAALNRFAAAQASVGVVVEPVGADGIHDLEPHAAAGLPGGVFYPQDMQVQPMLGSAVLLAGARAGGAVVHLHTGVLAIEPGSDGRVRTVITAGGPIHTRWVVNAAGTWGGRIAEMAGSQLPIMPRRGVIAVTEPAGDLVRHKVYTGDYVTNVASGDAELQSSAVVESTRSGTILIGASRERVGFDTTLDLHVLRVLARQAVEIFPILAAVSVMRVYQGFRPYSPDHLPVIGPDSLMGGLIHACGHEGAGVGLAPATGRAVAEMITGSPAVLDMTPFAPARFASGKRDAM